MPSRLAASLVAVGLSAVLAVLVAPRGMAAGPPELAGEHFAEDFGFDCEGLPVIGHIEGVHTHPIRTDQDGNVIFTDVGHWTVTLTGPTGKTLTDTYAGRQAHVGYENPDGTWTFVDTFTGIPTSLGGTGNGAIKDRGKVVFTTVVDFHDPDDPDDDEVVSFNIDVAGPHPQLESGLNGCDVLKAAIG